MDARRALILVTAAIGWPAGGSVAVEWTQPTVGPRTVEEEISAPTDPEIGFRPLREIVVEDRREEGAYPADTTGRLFRSEQPAPDTGSSPRAWAGSLFEWSASELHHQPLYFDDVPLENYGQTGCPLLQPVFSGLRFYGTLPVMPYKVGLDHPHECVSTLGTYRVGTCAPSTHQTLPLRLDAATLEAGAWVGLVFLLP